MRTVFRRIPLLVVHIVLTGSLLLPALAMGQWQGSTTQKEGVSHVSNPATAMESMLRLEPAALWEIGGYSEEGYESHQNSHT